MPSTDSDNAIEDFDFSTNSQSDDLSPEEIAERLEAIADDIQAPSSSSTSIPHKEHRECLNLLFASPDVNTAIKASTLYIQLMHKCLLAYDELSLGSCIYNICKLLKESPKRGASKSSPCSSPAYAKFWQHFVSLCHTPFMDSSNKSLLIILAEGFADIFRFSRDKRLLDLAVLGMKAVVPSNSASMSAVTAVYKALFAVALLNLPNPSRIALQDVLIHTSACALDGINSPTKKRLSEKFKEDVPQTPRRNSDSGVQEASVSNRNDCAIRESPQNPPVSKHQQPLLKFLELCCVHVIDKADERQSLVFLVHGVLCGIGRNQRESFARFLLLLTAHPKCSVRQFSVTLVAHLLKDANKFVSDDDLRNSLYRALSRRFEDRFASVRAKALSCFTELLRTNSKEDLPSSTRSDLFKTALNMTKRLQDENARVRKNGVDFIAALCSMCFTDWTPPTPVSETSISECPGQISVTSHPWFNLARLLPTRCTDSKALVRHSAITHLGDLMSNMPETDDFEGACSFFRVCLEFILPCVDDNDNRCREASFKVIQIFLLSKSKASGRRRSEEGKISPRQGGVSLADFLLLAMGREGWSCARLAQIAISILSKTDIIDDNAIKSLSIKAKASVEDNQIRERERRRGSWLALAAMTISDEMARRVKRCLGQELILDEIRSSFNPSAIKIACTFAVGISAKNREELERFLDSVLFSETNKHANDDRTDCMEGLPEAMRLLAELRPNDGGELLDRCERMFGGKGGLPDGEAIRALHLIGNISVSFEMRKEPPESLLLFVEALSSNEQSSSRVRALALATLGKICLGDALSNSSSSNPTKEQDGTRQKKIGAEIGEKLSRRFAPVFVHELDNATSCATRNNAVLVLCDLCRQYTAVVEPFISRIASLLSDPSVFVRTQVISSLICLLQEDYIKIRNGFVFYQIARCLLDEAEVVRSTAEYALLHVIGQKNPSLFAVSFVELIFVLNECKECGAHQNVAVATMNAGFNRIKTDEYGTREKIYNVFVKGMTAEQRLRLSGRMRSDVIGLILEEKISFANRAVQCVLEDTLALLSSPKLMNASGGGAEDRNDQSGTNETGDGGGGEQGGTEDGADVARSRVWRAVQAVQLREATIPILLELRQFLQKRRSPFLGALSRCISTLLHPHRRDLASFIADASTRAEIEHEMKGAGNKGGGHNLDEGGKMDAAEDAGKGGNKHGRMVSSSVLRDLTNARARKRNGSADFQDGEGANEYDNDDSSREHGESIPRKRRRSSKEHDACAGPVEDTTDEVGGKKKSISVRRRRTSAKLSSLARSSSMLDD